MVKNLLSMYSVKRIISGEDANMGYPEAMRWDKEDDKENIEASPKQRWYIKNILKPRQNNDDNDSDIDLINVEFETFCNQLKSPLLILFIIWRTNCEREKTQEMLKIMLI